MYYPVKYLVCLDASKLQHFFSDNWLLERLRPILRADFAISHRLFCRGTYVAAYESARSHHVRTSLDIPMGPVRSAVVVLKASLLRLQRLRRGKPSRRHTNILHMANLLASRVLRKVHRPAIPEHEVAGLHVDLDELAASLFEPFHVFLGEEEEVHELELWWRGVFVVVGDTLLRKELVEEFGRALHEH